MPIPARIGVGVSLAFAAIILVLLLSGAYGPVDLLFPGARGTGAAVVQQDFGTDAIPDRYAYDGQETYAIARYFPDIDAMHAGDEPVFRIRRILHPALVSWLPAGAPMVLAMSFLAVVGTGLAGAAIADFAERHGRDPRAGYAVAPAFAFSVIITTTEPLAFGLGLAGLALFDRGRWAAAIPLFALAGLGRETALVMALAAVIVTLGKRRWSLAGAVLVGSFLPFACWALWLRSRLPDDDLPSTALFGFLDPPVVTWFDVGLCAATLVLMLVGAWTWRDVPILALTALGFLGCCAFYIGDQWQFHGLPRVSAAAVAIGVAGLVPRPAPSPVRTAPAAT